MEIDKKENEYEYENNLTDENTETYNYGDNDDVNQFEEI